MIALSHPLPPCFIGDRVSTASGHGTVYGAYYCKQELGPSHWRFAVQYDDGGLGDCAESGVTRVGLPPRTGTPMDKAMRTIELQAMQLAYKDAALAEAHETLSRMLEIVQRARAFT